MNLLDYIAFIILGICLIRGIFRGLVKELTSLVGVLGGLYAVYAYHAVLARTLAPYIGNPAYANVAACLLLFGGVFLIIGSIGVVIKYVMNITSLGWTDRLTGAFFGMVKGVLAVSVVVLILTAFLPKNAPILRDSLAAHNLMYISATLARAASQDIRTSFGDKMKELGKTWQTPKNES